MNVAHSNMKKGDHYGKRHKDKKYKCAKHLEQKSLGREKALGKLCAAYKQSITKDVCKVLFESIMHKRTRHNRVRNFGWGHSCDCDSCNHCIQAEVRRTLECNIKRYHKSLRERNSEIVRDLCCEFGQSTVEYAAVFAALLCVLIGLGALMSELNDGVFIEHAISSASHCVEQTISGAADVFSF